MKWIAQLRSVATPMAANAAVFRLRISRSSADAVERMGSATVVEGPIREGLSTHAGVSDEKLIQRRRRLVCDACSEVPRDRRAVDSRGLADGGPDAVRTAHANRARHRRCFRLRQLELQYDAAVALLDLVQRRAEAETPAMQHREVVGHALDLVEQMRRENHGAPGV